MYRLFTTSVPAIIMSDEHIFDCWEDQAHCVKSPQNPLGPPIWKIFTFHFWPTAAHPLGHPWTISPEDYASQIMKATDENTYIPYSVEPSCDLQPLIPPTKRDQGRVWTLAKRLSYLTPHYERAWPASYLASVSRNTGAHFMLGAENDTAFTTEHIPSIDELGGERVVQNLGLLDRPQFMEEMAKSMVLLGVGRPAISPTPYQALCLGVPFINPIMDWDIDDPEERKGWWTQHDGLKFLDPPFVYNVRKDDESGLTKAITLAMQNPIPRYIPPGRSLPEAAVHMDAFLRRDWRSEAEALLAERIRTKQGERFTL
ncbi:hypothetical protein DL93DRAFT_2139922 [Clavulina sp. PMI_390]|nr:hypothetical protein DL93DRAFT_2139922 [Clavulina sp. PMI_390]